MVSLQDRHTKVWGCGQLLHNYWYTYDKSQSELEEEDEQLAVFTFSSITVAVCFLYFESIIVQAEPLFV